MLRIVPLIASASEIVHSLGLTQQQVGRSHECDYPDAIRSLPVCTAPAFLTEGTSAEIDRRVKEQIVNALSIYQVYEDVLDRLRPTHVITQTQCRVCAVSLEDVERALANSIASRPVLVSLEPNALADIWEDIRRVATACGVPRSGDELVQSLQARVRAIAALSKRSGLRPTVACIEWHEPLMAAGNWVPELVGLAGGVNLFGEAGRHSPWMTWDELLASDPDVIVTMPCGFDLHRTHQEMYWLTERPEWDKLRAVRTHAVFLADGNQYFNRPGPRIVESLQILGEILHPEIFPPTLKERAWKQWTCSTA